MEFVMAISAVGLLMLVMIGWSVCLGYVIYKDAKAHGLPAGMWTALAVLLPNLLGVIIYLVVRNNEEKKFICTQCGIHVEKDYNVCPNCRNTLGRICDKCKHGISEGCAYCPYCGEKVDEKSAHTTGGRKQVAKTNITKSLFKLGIAFIIILFAGFATVIGFGIAEESTFNSFGDYSIMNMETNIGNTRKAKFGYKQDHLSIRQKKQIGEELVIDPQIQLTKGDIQLKLTAPSGEVVFEESYQAPIDLHELVYYQVEEEGKYTLGIQVNAASGSYNISME